MQNTVRRTLATILVATFAVAAAVPVTAQRYRIPPRLPGPYSYGHSGCPGGYISILGDVCQPYFPPMRAGPREPDSCPPHYRLQRGICKRKLVR